MNEQNKGTLLDTGSTFFIVLGATADRGAKFGLADTETQSNQILASWKADGLTGEYAIFTNSKVGTL